MGSGGGVKRATFVSPRATDMVIRSCIRSSARTSNFGFVSGIGSSSTEYTLLVVVVVSEPRVPCCLSASPPPQSPAKFNVGPSRLCWSTTMITRQKGFCAFDARLRSMSVAHGAACRRAICMPSLPRTRRRASRSVRVKVSSPPCSVFPSAPGAAPTSMAPELKLELGCVSAEGVDTRLSPFSSSSSPSSGR